MTKADALPGDANTHALRLREANNSADVPPVDAKPAGTLLGEGI